MKRYISIGNRRIGAGHDVFVIAEVGVNHNGSVRLAKKMVDAAKLAGADAIKFQTFKTENLVTKDAPKANYQKKNSSDNSQFEMLKKLELSDKEFRILKDYCRRKKIIFLSTPFDSQSAKFLYKLGILAFKVGSGDLTNIPLLVQVANYKKPVILSTGMSALSEVKEAVEAIYSAGNKKLLLLHCTSNYPTKCEDVNLQAMDTLRRRFNAIVGYSDHTEGIDIPMVAVAMGACLIEKHFTLDRNLPGPDHKASLEPDEFKEMIQSIRDIEKAMGNGIKVPRKSERDIKKLTRKSIVAACDIPKGTRITIDMLSIKRPGIGIEPKYIGNIVGKMAKAGIKKDKLFTPALLA